MADKRFSGKYISILGDSLSTLCGYQPSEYPAFYGGADGGENGISAPQDMWWGQVIDRLGGELLVNNSYSGCLVCRHPECTIPSFGCSDERTGGLCAGGVMPDVIFVWMGLNDCGYGMQAEPGNEREEYDLSVFSVAYRTMLKKLRRLYPNAVVYCLTLPATGSAAEAREARLSAYNRGIAASAAACGCRVIALHRLCRGYAAADGLHPTAGGMRTIAAAVLSEMEGGQ